MTTVTMQDGEQVTLDATSNMHLQMGAFKDAGEAAFFQRELEFVKAKSYDVKYASLKARELFPVSNEAGEGAETITYRTFDQTGFAEFFNQYSHDIPRVDISGKETTIKIESIVDQYGYTIQEIRASQMAGRPIDQRRATMAARAIEQKINSIAFFGDDDVGMLGLFNNPNIPTGAVVNPGGGTEFVNKTADQILFDLNDIFNDISDNTKMVEEGNTLLLPPLEYDFIATTQKSSGSDKTVLQWLIDNSPYLNSLTDVIKLNECSSANNPLFGTNVMVAYNRSPDILQLEIPMEMTALAPQQKDYEFIVNNEARVAGLQVYYPLAVNIKTGI